MISILKNILDCDCSGCGPRERLVPGDECAVTDPHRRSEARGRGQGGGVRRGVPGARQQTGGGERHSC